MPLTWDVTEVENHQQITTLVAERDDPAYGVKAGQEQWHPVTMALVWHSLSTGIGSITEKNADEVYARIELCERLHGPTLRDKDGERPITPEDVRAHIGLHTNVGQTTTQATFLKRQAGSYLDGQRKHYRRSES